MALRHLPSGYAAVNAVWMWSALLALNISAWGQRITGLDGDGRAHAKRLRRELICVPGRLARHARGLILHLHPATPMARSPVPMPLWWPGPRCPDPSLTPP